MEVHFKRVRRIRLLYNNRRYISTGNAASPIVNIIQPHQAIDVFRKIHIDRCSLRCPKSIHSYNIRHPHLHDAQPCAGQMTAGRDGKKYHYRFAPSKGHLLSALLPRGARATRKAFQPKISSPSQPQKMEFLRFEYHLNFPLLAPRLAKKSRTR